MQKFKPGDTVSFIEHYRSFDGIGKDGQGVWTDISPDQTFEVLETYDVQEDQIEHDRSGPDHWQWVDIEINEKVQTFSGWFFDKERV